MGQTARKLSLTAGHRTCGTHSTMQCAVDSTESGPTFTAIKHTNKKLASLPTYAMWATLTETS